LHSSLTLSISLAKSLRSSFLRMKVEVSVSNLLKHQSFVFSLMDLALQRSHCYSWSHERPAPFQDALSNHRLITYCLPLAIVHVSWLASDRYKLNAASKEFE
jgi:hypothetical protein